MKLGKNGKPQRAPFFVDLSVDDFYGNFQEYQRYIESLRENYEAELDRAEPGEPLRSWFAPDTQGERQYSAALNRWSTKQGYMEAMKESQPKPTPEQMPRDLAALHYGDGEDKKRAAEVMAWRARMAEQITKAEKREALDGYKSPKVKEYLQRASQYKNTVEELEGQRYGFEKKGFAESTKWGEGELEKWMKAKPEEVEKNMDHIQGLIQGYRAMSDTDYSFALDGNQVVKLNHPGTPAHEIEARMGTTEDRHLLLKLSQHGIERHEEPKPEKEEPAPAEEEGKGPYAKYEKMSNKDFAEMRDKQEGKTNQSILKATVVPGMFGG